MKTIIFTLSILCQKIDKWNVPEDIHDEYLWRLGNLTLLGQEYNKKATNSTFDKSVLFIKIVIFL